MSKEHILTLNTADRTILRSLFASRSGPLSLYKLHIENHYSPAQLGSFVSKMSEIGVINIYNEHISLTDHGVMWIIAHRQKIFLSTAEFEWKKPPEGMRKKRVSVNEFYVPKRRALGKYFLEDVFDKRK